MPMARGEYKRRKIQNAINSNEKIVLCYVCERWLVTDRSRAIGMGPTCRRKAMKWLTDPVKWQHYQDWLARA